jgi:Fe-S cluster biogenesis protein NfuA
LSGTEPIREDEFILNSKVFTISYILIKMTFVVVILLLAALASDYALKQMPLQRRLIRSNARIYGESGSFDFDLVRPAIQFSLSEVLVVAAFLKDYDLGSKIQGVYAIQNLEGTVLYVGASMTVPVEIDRLVKTFGNETVNSVRIQTFPTPKLEAFEAYKFELIRQLSPSGNLNDPELWGDRAINFDFNEEKKEEKVVVKDDATDKKISASRERLANAVGGDANRDSTIESPFAEESDPGSYVIGPNASNGLEFTKENVDKVLDEVRPYLIADGGNVEVVSVEEFTRTVNLVLQGACGSCPSSTTTMKMGIERVLKENFPNLGPVLQVEPTAKTGLTIEDVEKALEKVLPAIKAMGGLVEVGAVESETGVVTLRYKGPARLKVGIQLVMKDISLVKSTIIEDMVDLAS